MVECFECPRQPDRHAPARCGAKWPKRPVSVAVTLFGEQKGSKTVQRQMQSVVVLVPNVGGYFKLHFGITEVYSSSEGTGISVPAIS